jgi:hypothetical protein
MTAKNRAIKCSQLVRNLPLERYRLPDDGRKWKQAARSRSAFLGRLATYANGDGTFVRNGRNYSPSLKTLLKHVAHGSYYKLTDELQVSGLLSWTREKHYDRRVYTIHLSEQVQDSPENRSNIEDESGPTFNESGPTFKDEHQEQVQHSQNQVQHSPITGPTSGKHPSYPSKEPLVQPTSLPTNPRLAGGMAGCKEILKSKATPTPADKEELLLTEERMTEALQKAHAKKRNEHNDRTQGRMECIPLTPNIAGSKKLFDELRKRGITRVDQLNLVSAAYGIWFDYKYALSFEEKRDAECKKEEIDDAEGWMAASKVYIPNEIKHPLAMFRKELCFFLNVAREEQDGLELES